MSSTSPLVFIKAAITLLSLRVIPEKYAADPAPAYWNRKNTKK